MIIAPAYIAVRFLQRFIDFFIHWYGGGTRVFWTQTSYLLTKLRGFLERPLKRGAVDLFFWSLHVLGVALAYLVVVVISFVLYVGWILLPPYVFLKTLDALFVNV